MMTLFYLCSAITFVTILLSTASPPLTNALGSGFTIAISYGFDNSTTICGIIAGCPTQRIQCFTTLGYVIAIQPNSSSFESISGGRSLLCGLKSGGLSLLCWDTAMFHPKRIYRSSSLRLTNLTVGDSHACAIRAGDDVAVCWRLSPSPEVAWKFSTITSGLGFSCGVLRDNSRVKCWGKSVIGGEIEGLFSNLTMLSLVAGQSHACGLAENGTLICNGRNESGQLNVPSHKPFQFSTLALGLNHSCAIQRKNGVVMCWGGGFEKSDSKTNFLESVSFEAIQSGLDFTCGLTTKNLSVICWGPGWKKGIVSENVVPLSMVLPGPCVQSTCSTCGVYPDSDIFCAGTESICRSCVTQLPIPALLPPFSPSPSPTSQYFRPQSMAKKRALMAFAIVGSVGVFSSLCSIAFCLWKGVLLGLFGARTSQPAFGTNMGRNIPPLGSSSLKQENSSKLSRERSESSSKHIDKVEQYSLQELVTVTNDFSLGNKIGGGSFGTVYKGKLGNGREVAVKRGEVGATTKKFQEKESAFNSELALLSRIHHKHLVALLGFCQEKDEKLLVYEFMSSGSLYDHLHSKNNVDRSSSFLNFWKMRIKIALDASRGIEYLHRYAVPPIIHRDIKSSNILIDENYGAKVSDFGLSLMGFESDQERISTKAVGTIGYIDPEYYAMNTLTTKSDVYSLGVVLLELLTGKRAMFKERGPGPTSLVDYAGSAIASGDIASVLDERVGAQDANETEAVELVAYAAVSCVSLQGRDRPSISEVVVILERALALCEGSNDNGEISLVPY